MEVMPPVELPPTPPQMGAAPAATPAPAAQGPQLPATGPNSYTMWKSRLEESQSVVDQLKVAWDTNQDRYLAKKPLGSHDTEIIVPIDYANVEQKKAALFFQNPKVLITPLLPGLEKAAPVFESVVNYRLGRKGVNAKAAVDEVLSDALCSSGIFAVKIGYEATVKGTKQIQSGTGPDPNWRPAIGDLVKASIGLAPAPQAPLVPQYTQIPNIIAEKYIFERISPAKLLIPKEFTGSDYDKAPWLAFEFLMDLEVAKRVFVLPERFSATQSQDSHLIGTKTDTSGKTGTKVKGWEIYFKTSVFDPAEVHPDHQTLLVIIDGIPEPVKYRPSPYQIVNPDGTIGGMSGFPIHVGALRYVSDSAYPPSDCQMSRYQSDEISKGRTQMMWQRIRSTPMRIVDLVGIGGPDGLAKLEKNIWQGIFPVTQLDPMPIKEVPMAQMPQQNFTFDSIARRDVSDVWAMGPNQIGNTNPTDRTATELTLAQNSGSTRLTKERTKFLDWFVRGAEKLAALIQMFADEKSYIDVVGPDGAKTLMEWDKSTIQGTYAFDIKPNSSAPTDAASERAQFLQAYNLLASSPTIDRIGLDVEAARIFDLPPEKVIKKPQPMAPPPEKPKISFAFNDQSVDPSNPAFPIIMEILKTGGIIIDEKAILAAQQAAGKMQTAMGAPQPVVADAVPHPTQPPPPPPPSTDDAPGGGAEPLNKHQLDQTGSRPGPRVGGMTKLT